MSKNWDQTGYRKGNLLGGRAWRYEMHPLVSAEVDDLNLLRALNRERDE